VARAVIANVATRPLAVGCSELCSIGVDGVAAALADGAHRVQELGFGGRRGGHGERRYVRDGAVPYLLAQELIRPRSASIITRCTSQTDAIMCVINRPADFARKASPQVEAGQRVRKVLSSGIITPPS